MVRQAFKTAQCTPCACLGLASSAAGVKYSAYSPQIRFCSPLPAENIANIFSRLSGKPQLIESLKMKTGQG